MYSIWNTPLVPPPPPYVCPSDRKRIKTSLLEETWLGGIESPQYIATKDSAILEPPSKMDKESTLKKMVVCFSHMTITENFQLTCSRRRGVGVPRVPLHQKIGS